MGLGLRVSLRDTMGLGVSLRATMGLGFGFRAQGYCQVWGL